MTTSKVRGWWRVACLTTLLLPRLASAQHQEHAAASPGGGWAWTLQTRAFLSANLQERKFRDFHVVESQNWMMASAVRPIRRARISFNLMASAEAYTLRGYGSPQVFQTGETYGGAALVDYQHPHDVLMGASARLEMPLGQSRWQLALEGGPVGAPAFGPTVFMHRPSAASNPTVPLSHHHLDAMHVTHGVATVGVMRSGWTWEASAFHGREPDEDRLRVEFGPIDSYATRVQWRNARWTMQASAAMLSFPDPTEFTDSRRLSISASYADTSRARPIALTVAYGLMRETALDVTSPAWLAEGEWDVSMRTRLYARAEWLRLDILTRGGYDPPGFIHPHTLSRVGAFTAGSSFRLADTRSGRWSIGADATMYVCDRNLDDNYGRPFSMHAYLDWSFALGHR